MWGIRKLPDLSRVGELNALEKWGNIVYLLQGEYLRDIAQQIQNGIGV